MLPLAQWNFQWHFYSRRKP